MSPSRESESEIQFMESIYQSSGLFIILFVKKKQNKKQKKTKEKSS